MTTSNKFLAAFLSFALVLLGALVSIPQGAFTWQAGIQIGILAVSTGATLGLKLVPSVKWQGVLKTGSAVILAILSGLTPLILGGKYDHVTIGLIVLAVVQVVASEIGVQARIASTPTAPATA